HEHMTDPRAILLRLKALYGEKSRTARYQFSKELFSTKKPEGASINDHCLKMITCIELASLGFIQDVELSTYVILLSLPPPYSQFIINFNMNKVKVSLFEIFNMLRDTEIHLSKSEHVMHLTHARTKLRGRMPLRKARAKANRVASDISYTSSELFPKGSCFYCGVVGHWKRNYKKFLSSIGKPQGKGEPSIFMIQINMSIDKSYSTSWVLDTGCSSHICVNVQDVQGSKTLAKGEVDLKIANGTSVEALAIRSTGILLSSSKSLELKNTLFV
ncbi:LOW QUALITY PROTEIN: UBN2_2 domain-containing protein, partial [Cephalotus follicularis]